MAFLTATAQAAPWWANGAKTTAGSSIDDFLPPDRAFKPEVRLDGRLLRIRWQIADGYYLYRSRFNIMPQSPGLSLDAPTFPQGITKTDPYLGTQEIYKEQMEVIVGYTQSDAGAHPMAVKLTYQGCAEAGLCYPPIVKILGIRAGSAMRETAPRAAVYTSGRQGVFTAIIAGIAAFFAAGLWMRRARHDKLF